MDFRARVVVHFKDGEVKKGYTQNFSFFRETFDLVEVDSQTKEEAASVVVPVEDLKAVFFVKDFDGDSEHRPYTPAERFGFGEKVEITFEDNETLVGYTHSYRKNNKGFILYPADYKTNNEIVAVLRSATRMIKAEKRHSYFNV